MSRTRKLLAALVVAGVAAVGVSAFTNSNSFDVQGPHNAGQVAGYGTESVSGVVAHSVKYVTPGDGTNITEVDLVLAGDTTRDDISYAFNGGSLQPCIHAAETESGGTYDPPPGTDTTSYTCTLASPQDTSAVTDFALVGTNKVNP
jgi:hypothetical protein